MTFSRIQKFDQLIGQFVEVLKKDGDITGALLAGSIGRGVEDINSDVDFYVFVKKGLRPAYEVKARDLISQLGSLLLFYQLDSVNVGILEDFSEIDFTFRDVEKTVPKSEYVGAKVLFDNLGDFLKDLVARSELEAKWPPREEINNLRALIRGKFRNLLVAYNRKNSWEAKSVLETIRQNITRLYAGLARKELNFFKRIGELADDWFLTKLKECVVATIDQLKSAIGAAFELLQEVEAQYSQPYFEDLREFDVRLQKRLALIQ